MAVKGMSEFRADGENYTINDPNIANEFSTSAAYAAGDYVYYQGNLYRFTAAHAAGAWAGTDATQVKLGGDVSDLKSAMYANKRHLDDQFHFANLFDFTAKDVMTALAGVKINSIGIDKLNASYPIAANTGIYLPVTLNAGTYTINATFTAEGLNNVRIFSGNKSELIRLASGTPETLTVSNDNTLYYVRLYFQALNSVIDISKFIITKPGDEDRIKDTLLPDNIAYYKKIIGQIGKTSDFDNVGYLNNSGQYETSQSYADYRYSDILPITIGSTIRWTYTGVQLNTQVGGYFLGNSWVDKIGNATPDSNGVYTLTLRDDIVYDGIVLNMYAATINIFEAYANCSYGSMDSIYYELDKPVYVDPETNNNKWNGKTWVALGDSWTAGAYTDTCGRYSDYVADQLGLTQINLGVGGTGVEVFAEQTGKPLTQEIANSADLITIWGSINNMAQNGAVCGTIDDAPSASGSLMARWKYTIEKVLALNPLVRVVIIGCPPSFHSSWTGYEPYNTNGDTIEHSTEMIGKLARHYGFPFVDMYHLSGFNEDNFGNSADNNYGYDKVHPSRLGVKRAASVLIGELLKLQEYIV